MNLDNQDPAWEKLSQNIFTRKEVRVPAFLWTRILAMIEEQERRLQNVWWAQWSWMGRVTAAVALLVLLSAGFVTYQSAAQGGAALEMVMQGQTEPTKTIRLSSTHAPNHTDITAWVLEDKPWQDD